MGPLDALWHLMNFVGPAIGVALLSTTLAKLWWRRELATVSWHRMASVATIAGTLSLVIGLIVFGRDGKMATYSVLVVASALALWWIGFVRR
jgi:Na+/H+ antiporter NhaA